VAATASILMRAFRSTDSSYHTWRAGNYDPTMSDAVGDQVPPHPIVQYSDFVVVGTLGGPLARTDAEGFTLAGLGTSGSPVTFTTAPGATFATVPGLDCRDYESITVWVYITTPGTATEMRLFCAWAAVDAAVGSDFSSTRSDDQIASGISPQNLYQAVFVLPTPDNGLVGPFNIPVRGRRALIAVQTDTGDLEGYALAMRHA